MTLLFVTRKYPPRHGGMERFSFELFRHWPTEKKLVASRQGNRLAILWLAPWLFFRAWPRAYRADCLLMADGVLAPVGSLLKRLTGKPLIVVVHGLEMTYRLPLFKSLIWRSLRRADAVVTVSQHTKELAVAAGVKPEMITVIPNGVNDPDWPETYSRSDLDTLLGQPTDEQLVLLSLGRLVERKGVAWFIEQVAPKLTFPWLYVVAGDGPAADMIHQAVERSPVAKQIIRLGAISDQQKEILFQTADVFVMPNIPVPGDAEGFGIVALEAAAHSQPVVASRLEGLQEAIVDQANGWLVEPLQAEGFVRVLTMLATDAKQRAAAGQAARSYTLERYHWPKVAHQYVELAKQISQP